MSLVPSHNHYQSEPCWLRNLQEKEPIRIGFNDNFAHSEEDRYRVVVISDTHNFHPHLKFPPSDNRTMILIHCGDMTDHGTEEEMIEFNTWLGTVRERYNFREVYCICGYVDNRQMVLTIE